MAGAPRLLVTGFGPFPGAPKNPTEALVHALAAEPPAAFGVSVLTAAVLPTEYGRSWAALRRLCLRVEPDVVVHFGLSARAKAIHIETLARNRIDPAKPDAAGSTHRSGLVRRSAAETLTATLPSEAIAAALSRAGFPVVLSDDAGGYVCNATLYRSLHAAPRGRRVGLMHVPGQSIMPTERLLAAAKIILKAALQT